MEYNVKIEDEKTLILKFNGVGNFIKEISENRIVCNGQFVHSIRDILKSHAINTNPSPTSTFDSIIDGHSIRFEQQDDSLLIYKYRKDSIKVEEVVEEPVEEEYQLPTHRKPYREELNKYKADQASRSKVGSLLSLLALSINDQYDINKGHKYLNNFLTKEEMIHFHDCMNSNQIKYGAIIYATKHELVRMIADVTDLNDQYTQEFINSKMQEYREGKVES